MSIPVQHLAVGTGVGMGIIDCNAFEWSLGCSSDGSPKRLSCLPPQADIVNRQE